MLRLAAAVAALLCLLPASVPALEVPLTVEEPSGAERKLEVVSGGIPLPEGKYKDPAGFSLFDGGTEVPVQVDSIVKYPDGSLHWALVSFPVSLPTKGKKTLALRDAPGKAAPPSPVTVKETGDVVEVSNGLVSFTVNKASFNGFESVKLGGKEVFKAAKAGLVAGGKGGPGKPISFAYAYRGPVRTTLYIKGGYGEEKVPTWAMSITLNAGESAIRIEHALRNAGKDAKDLSVESAALRLGLAGGDLTAGQNGGSGQGGAFGWQAFTGAADLLVFMRHGGRGNSGNYKVAVAEGELAIDLSPNAGAYKLTWGAHKDTEIDLVFGKTKTPEGLASPLHALAPCAYYAEHDGMGIGRGFGSLADETATYKEMGLAKFDDPKKFPRQDPSPAFYVGDFDAHATSECDHLQGMVFGYLRTGQRGYLDQAAAWARYWRTYLLYRSDEWEYGKDGKYPTPKWGTGRVCSEGCHFYAAGLFNYALITGSIDSLEGAFDAAEFANVAWYGPYAGKKPGDNFSGYGSRGFSRCYIVMSRAYDVARDDKWRKYLVHYALMGTRTPRRDPRGFCWADSMSGAGSAMDASKGSPEIQELIKQEGVQIEGNKCKHPKYGSYMPVNCGTWPEAMIAQANYVSWQALSASSDPEAQVAGEDVMDYAVAQANFGAKYAFSPVQKAVYYYMHLDFPLPDMIPQWNGGKYKEYQANGTDSWYTKWWPNVLAAGYLLTGDKALKAKSREILWWGLSRDYVSPPSVPQGEAPTYARVERNTKGDWMTPTSLAIGLVAHPRKDEQPPKAVADLKATAAGGGKVELSWTAPADEGGGKVVRYQVKWSEKPIKDYLDINYREEGQAVCYWNIATNVAGEPAPQAPGAAEKLTVTVPAGKALHFAVRSFDDSSNMGAISNVVKVDVK
ncbi:MAG TPA: hypothetical protein PK280_13215 [Planctomycetota bacterium]|nr:hypothetical protein [Planctomycetota bacterium]